MGIAGVKIKIMPDSPEADVQEIEKNVKEIVESKGGRNREYEIQPIAFGLNAVIAFFEISEDVSVEEMEDEIQKMGNISSTQVIDMRKIA